MKMSFLVHAQQVREALQETLEKGEIITGIKKMFRLEHEGGGITLFCVADTIHPDDGHLKKDVAGFSVILMLTDPPGSFEIVAEYLGGEEGVLAQGEEIDPSNSLIEFVRLEGET